jgi:hypothetical protein
MTTKPQFTLNDTAWDALAGTGELDAYTASEDGQLDTLLDLLNEHDVLTPPAAFNRAALYLNHGTDNYVTVGILLRPEWPLIESVGEDATR